MVDCTCIDCVQTRKERDAEWSRVLGVEAGKVLTPAEAAEWIEKDRVARARNVLDARQQRGPVRW